MFIFKKGKLLYMSPCTLFAIAILFQEISRDTFEKFLSKLYKNL